MSGEIKIMGAKEAEAYLKKLSAGVRAPHGKVVRVGTWLKYAWGIEFGERRDGRLARRAGGSFALTDAFQEAKPKIAPTLARAIPKGPAATLSALKWLGLKVLGGTIDKLTSTVYATPEPRTKSGKFKYKRTGNLRRSYHVDGPR